MRRYFAAKYYFPFKWFTITHTMQNPSTYLQGRCLKSNGISIWLQFPDFASVNSHSVPPTPPQVEPTTPFQARQTCGSGWPSRGVRDAEPQWLSERLVAQAENRAAIWGGRDYSERGRHSFFLPSTLPELRRRWVWDCGQSFCHHTQSLKAGNRKERD